MVLDYYKLREEPFGVTPDSRRLYTSATHREALASLLYGIEAGRGFVALIAEPGMGKTTLLHSALRQIGNKARTAFIFQTIGTPDDFLRGLLRDLGVMANTGSLNDLQAKLNEVLAEQSRLGKSLVVVVDEAQNLDVSVLELLRMLSNFESAQAKLLQIILSGQPQLAAKLASPELVQLRQRVSIVARLKPFTSGETALYMEHRLRTAGYSSSEPLFTGEALALIAEHSEGIPRNINNLCFNALSLGCVLKKAKIDGDILREVIGDLDLKPLRARESPSAQPEDAGLHTETPALVRPAIQRPLLAGWPRKLALAFTILLVACASLVVSPHFRSNRWASPQASVQAASVAPAAAPEDSPSLQILQEPEPAAATVSTQFIPIRAMPPRAGTVQVAPGQTLYRICVESFGRCNGELLQEIHRLNPGLRSMSHLEPGWTIRIPIATQNGWHKAAAASLSEKGTQ